eukprot:jgi/Picre1/35851/NNA_003311.t1
MVLFKMLNRGVFSEINGCISTGKEANVYHATEDASGVELAIKVYKTAILVFKDRDRYVTGDSRFQRFCKSNPRKMVKMWAEKEMRNLSRLQRWNTVSQAHPTTTSYSSHGVFGDWRNGSASFEGRRAASCKDEEGLHRSHSYPVVIVPKVPIGARRFFRINLLVHNDEIHVIDVSQSVELDHPRAFDFLREDCKHSNDYFRRQGVATLTNKELFDFVVNPALTDENLDAELDALMETAAARPIVQTVEEEVAEKVWSQAYIPKKLEEVVHFERDHERLQKGENTEGIYYQAIAGMKEDMSGAIVDNDSEAVEEEEIASSSDGSESDDEHMFEERQKLSKEEIRELRKANKKQVKADKAEKRKTKVKKHVKKRATKKKKP